MTIIDESLSEIIIFDHLDPEAAAMALALYSRDPRSVKIHLERIKEVGAEKFMATYYVGYGHKSIGDCGSTTICVENGSMLAAKAVQDDELYLGQEASTRYLDMANQPVLNPLGTAIGAQIQTIWMFLYSRALEILVPFLKEKYPILETDDLKIYEKAIKAKAFDIARAFLPAGCTTFVGWHTNLRYAHDRLIDLLHHPLPEVRSLARQTLTSLKERYASSFGFEVRPEQEVYYNQCSELVYENLRLATNFACTHTMDTKRLYWNSSVKELLRTRPPKTELPDWFKRYGQIQFQFLLDFGSFRDIQRHRSCTQIMPLLTTHYGFHPWYLESLPDSLKLEAEKIMREQEARIESIADPKIRQYYIAMGYQVACEITGGLPSMVYIAELRSTQAVHPTLRPVAQQMGKTLMEMLPGTAIHCDMGPEEWSTKRGKHDIVRKE